MTLLDSVTYVPVIIYVWVHVWMHMLVWVYTYVRMCDRAFMSFPMPLVSFSVSLTISSPLTCPAELVSLAPMVPINRILFRVDEMHV